MKNHDKKYNTIFNYKVPKVNFLVSGLDYVVYLIINRKCLQCKHKKKKLN